MPKTIEYKDAKGKNRIRHTADNGKVTYSSSQGYENMADMRQAAVNSAIELLEHFADQLTFDQGNRIIRIPQAIK